MTFDEIYNSPKMPRLGTYRGHESMCWVDFVMHNHFFSLKKGIEITIPQQVLSRNEALELACLLIKAAEEL